MPSRVHALPIQRATMWMGSVPVLPDFLGIIVIKVRHRPFDIHGALGLFVRAEQFFLTK